MDSLSNHSLQNVQTTLMERFNSFFLGNKMLLNFLELTLAFLKDFICTDCLF